MFDNLDPATVPFRKHSVTILGRASYFDNPTLFNTLTEDHVLSWINAGVGTVADIRETGNAAIPLYHEEIARLRQFGADLASMAEEPWAKYVWSRDPRFKAYLPKDDSTVYDDIATSGTGDDRRCLWENQEALKEAVAAQATLTLPDAISQYVGAISGQHGERLGMLPAVTDLNGLDPISDSEGSRRIGRSRVRVGQMQRRLFVLRDQARPPAGAWIPQVGAAERDGWPDEDRAVGVEATRGFFSR